MKQIRNLEQFYIIIDDQIKLVSSYMEKKYMDPIIRICRLKPYYSLYGSKQSREDYRKLKLHKWWVDEFGNSLKIIKNKRTKIIIEDPELQNKILPFTDLYGSLPLDKSILITKLLLIVVEKNKTDIALIGLDNYLRCYRDEGGQWYQISPLQLGIKTLISIVNNSDIKYFKKLQNKVANSWVGKWPPHNDFLETITQYDNISKVLKLIKGEK